MFEDKDNCLRKRIVQFPTVINTLRTCYNIYTYLWDRSVCQVIQNTVIEVNRPTTCTFKGYSLTRDAIDVSSCNSK